MPKSLAEGHIRIAVLTDEPADPQNPTTTELNAGINASPNVLDSDWTYGYTDSDKTAEKPVDQTNNANALGADNGQCAMTIFREFDADTGQVDPTGDALFTACQAKGTTLYVYERQNGNDGKSAWASGDEVFGMQTLTDNPQKPSDNGGYIKRRIPTEPQLIYGLGTVA